jgi:hypothetical protein
MLHFIQNFVYYITFEVIHPRHYELMSEIQHAKDLNEIMEIHEKFLDNCLKECLLANQELLKILTKIMTTCLLYADHMIRFMNDCANNTHNTMFQQRNSGKSTAAGEYVDMPSSARDRSMLYTEFLNTLCFVFHPCDSTHTPDISPVHYLSHSHFTNSCSSFPRRLHRSSEQSREREIASNC